MPDRLPPPHGPGNQHVAIVTGLSGAGKTAASKIFEDLGYTVVEMPVSHHPRTAGETKYGMGIVQRALPGLVDCLAVRYMRNRRRPVTNQEIRP